MGKQKIFFGDLIELNLKNNVRREIILTYERIKPMSRILISNGEELLKIKEFLEKYDIFYKIANFRIKGLKDKGKGGFMNRGTILPQNNNLGKSVVYLSRKEKNVYEIDSPKVEKNSDNLGYMLGYPNCCRAFFNNYYKEASKKQGDLTLFSLKETKGGYPFNLFNNFPSSYFDRGLISHYPCSFKCKETAKIAKKSLDKLNLYSKEFSKKIMEIQRSVVIYTEYNGIFLLKKYDYEFEGVSFDSSSVQPTIKNSIFYCLKKGDEIKINSEQNFEIIGKKKTLLKLKGENVGIMIFDNLDKKNI